MPFHVRITQKSDKTNDEVKLDLTKDHLVERILTPYREGRPIVIGGKTIPPDDIEKIHINETEETSDELIPKIKEERRKSNVIVMISDEWYVTDKGKDVTDDYITGPPGSGVIESQVEGVLKIQGPKVVFVIHGKNLKIRDSMFAFLRSLGLHPLEWIEALTATGKGSPYVGEVLDKAFSTAQAVIALMTPDDEARLRKEFRKESEPIHETELTFQARSNVIFEAGMGMGRDPDRTILVELGTLRPFSDVYGRHVVRMDNSTQRRQELALKLQAAGCPVNLSSIDWQTAGNFDLEDMPK